MPSARHLRGVAIIGLFFFITSPRLLWSKDAPHWQAAAGGAYHLFEDLTREEDTDATFGRNGYGFFAKIGRRQSNHWGWDLRGKYLAYPASTRDGGPQTTGQALMTTVDSLVYFTKPGATLDVYWPFGLGGLLSNIRRGIYSETGLGLAIPLTETFQLLSELGAALSIADGVGADLFLNVGLGWRW